MSLDERDGCTTIRAGLQGSERPRYHAQATAAAEKRATAQTEIARVATASLKLAQARRRTRHARARPFFELRIQAHARRLTRTFTRPQKTWVAFDLSGLDYADHLGAASVSRVTNDRTAVFSCRARHGAW
eukprot:6208311-Pleurochrysis_carterae.AAC.4